MSLGTADEWVTIERRQRVGVVVINHPPSNALDQPIRVDLLRAIELLDSDETIDAIVISGAGSDFLSGPDIQEFDTVPHLPTLGALLLRLENCTTLVLACLHGTVSGGGADLALACHYRAATQDLALCFPEIHLGLLPEGGATARLPRLVGMSHALELMIRGMPLGYQQAVSIGLVDYSLSGNVQAEAVAYAQTLVANDAPLRRTRDMPAPPDAKATVESWRKQIPPKLARIPSAMGILDAVSATLDHSFDAALTIAERVFDHARLSVESRALRNLFSRESQPHCHSRYARKVVQVAVIGSGTMGIGIGISLITSGYRVVMQDRAAGALENAKTQIEAALQRGVSKGRLSSEAAKTASSQLCMSTDLRDVADCELVIEAVSENLSVKQQVFAELGHHCRPGAILATNTSTLDVDAIASASGRSGDVIGMHFFSPANVMRLVEIVRGAASSREALETAATVARSLGKISIQVDNSFGFVGNRMLYSYGRERELLLLQGASVTQIDSAMEAFGMAMGPNAVGDLAGLDVGYQARLGWHDRPDDPLFFRVSDLLVENGRLGQKTGAGFYRYTSDGLRQPDASVQTLIENEAALLGVERREIRDDEIVDRCMLALINEGAAILGEGIAQRAADIDVIWCNGYGFPRFRGGPMYYADTLGLPQVLQKINTLAIAHGNRYWTAPPLLTWLANNQRGFASIDSIGDDHELQSSK